MGNARNPPEMMMPVPDDRALRQFEIEALRAITDNLRRLNEGMGEQTRTLHTIDIRLTKIESNSVSAEVVELKTKVDRLETERDRREGAKGLFEWVLKYGPTLFGFLVLILIVLKANNKI